MVIPFFCPLRATAIAMAMCTAWVPAAAIGRPRPMARSTRGTSSSIRAERAWAAALGATVNPCASSKIEWPRAPERGQKALEIVYAVKTLPGSIFFVNYHTGDVNILRFLRVFAKKKCDSCTFSQKKIAVRKKKCVSS